MKQKHTATPWAINDVNTSLVYSEKTALNLARAFGENKEANARRIVAAVNATKGIKTELLETAFGEGMVKSTVKIHTEFATLRQQNADLAKTVDWYGKLLCRRDEQITELIEVLKETDDYLSENQLNYVGHKSILHSKMIAAIAKHVPTDTAAAESSKKDIETLMEKGLQYLMQESSTPPFFDPHGLEPKGVISAALSKHAPTDDAPNPDPSQPAQVIANLTRKLGDAIKALHMIATYQPETGQCDNGYSPKYMAESVIATYGTGPVIQERPRPEGEWRFEVEE